MPMALNNVRLNHFINILIRLISSGSLIFSDITSTFSAVKNAFITIPPSMSRLWENNCAFSSLNIITLTKIFSLQKSIILMIFVLLCYYNVLYSQYQLITMDFFIINKHDFITYYYSIVRKSPYIVMNHTTGLFIYTIPFSKSDCICGRSFFVSKRVEFRFFLSL